jgi:hypothetical protein
VDLELRYPLIALLNGPVLLPPLPLQMTGAREAASEPSAVLVREDSGAVTGGQASVGLALGGIQVALPDSVASATGTLQAAPAAGPLGGEWSIWHLLVLVVLLAGIGLTAWLLVRSRGLSPGSGSTELDRRGALRELDALRDRGWHRSGRTREFYTSLTDILRRFAHRIDPDWPPGLTSLELAAALRRNGDYAERASIEEAIRRAESVKFGHLAPEEERADEDWRDVRRLVAEYPGDL